MRRHDAAMEHDPGRTAMWICGALLGLLRHKGLVTDPEIQALARHLEASSAEERSPERADMQRAADWLRYSITPAND
jgi:hypothetical protein